MSAVIQRQSPNWNHRPVGTAIDCVVLHATADTDTRASVDWCCEPKSKNPDPVSYHAIVDRDGTLYALVDTDHRAWHAGVSAFNGRPNCNNYSIGLSFANRNDGREPYSDAQYDVGAAVVAGYMKKYPAITLERITTHAIVALPLGRKTDPLAFNLSRFLILVQANLVPSHP